WSCASVTLPPTEEPPTVPSSAPATDPPAETTPELPSSPPEGPARPSGPLPRTGSDPVGPAMLGSGILCAGASLVLLARDRRRGSIGASTGLEAADVPSW